MAGSPIILIAQERYRQRNDEGWTPEHDDCHKRSELVLAAACYAVPAYLRNMPDDGITLVQWLWPWSRAWWKPTPEDRIRELVKAGALIVAEIERLQRLANH